MNTLKEMTMNDLRYIGFDTTVVLVVFVFLFFILVE